MNEQQRVRWLEWGVRLLLLALLALWVITPPHDTIKKTSLSAATVEQGRQ